MPSRRHILLTGLGIAILVAGLATCKPDASPQAKDAEQWLIGFYGHYQIRGGWGIFGIEGKDDHVDVYINVPARQATELQNFDEEKRMRFIAFNACPPFNEQVWSRLTQPGDIIIKTRVNGNVFATVPCRANNKGNPL